jgi:ComF family protein
VTALAALGRRALDLVLPPLCLVCRAPIGAEGALCPACWSRVRFIAPPHCARCGLPFDESAGPHEICAGCAARPPRFDRARAVMRYDDGSRPLILRFKNADRLHAAPALARWLARAAGPLLHEAELIVPVPLHWRRLLRRRYNQSAELARALAKVSGRPVSVDAVRRLRHTPAQGHLNPAERRANVRAAFAVPERRRALIRGRRVLVVDDVLTTGATLDAVARALTQAGAAAVDAVTLARVVRSE